MKIVLCAYGTRPEAIKLAPLIASMRESGSLTPIIAVSGQHREMLDQVNDLFGIEPNFDLNIIRPGQSLTDITAKVITGYSDLLSNGRFDAVVVQGDTTTTFAAALSAFYCHIPVVHLEAGLRTGNRLSPYPEEINRRLTTQLASLHLAPTALNKANLLRDGVEDAVIHVTGNTVIDAFLQISSRGEPVGNSEVDLAIQAGRRLIVVTAHRRESWGLPLQRVGRAVARLGRSFDDILVVIPVHKNPIVRDNLLPPIADVGNVVVTEPLDYGPFCTLIASATLILTDSGGVQEEAPSLGKPVLVLRDTTERPEAVTAGTVALVGTNEDAIFDAASRLLADRDAYRAMARAVNPYGDGMASSRASAAISALLGVGDRIAEFQPRVSD